MMKYFTHTNAGKLKLNFRTKMNLLTTGLIFVLLLLSTFLGNGVMILLIPQAHQPDHILTDPASDQTGITVLSLAPDHIILTATCRSTSPYIGRGYSSSIHRKL